MKRREQNCDIFRRQKHPQLEWMQEEEGKKEAKMTKADNVKEGH